MDTGRAVPDLCPEDPRMSTPGPLHSTTRLQFYTSKGLLRALYERTIFAFSIKNRCLPPKLNSKQSDPGCMERPPDWWLHGYCFSLGILSPWGFPPALGISKHLCLSNFQQGSKPRTSLDSFTRLCLKSHGDLGLSLLITPQSLYSHPILSG